MDKRYVIGLSADAAARTGAYYDFYYEAVEAVEYVREKSGLTLNIYKIETTISEATHYSEGYREY